MRDERQNLVAASVDIAVRMGTLEDSTFGARRITPVPRILVESPEYLARRGPPRSPEELEFHDALIYEQSIPEQSILKMMKAGTTRTVALQGRVRIDSAPGILAAAVAGLGIANVTTVRSAQERHDGRLIRLLPEYGLEPLNAFAFFPSGPRPSAKVQALTAHLIAELGN